MNYIIRAFTTEEEPVYLKVHHRDGYKFWVKDIVDATLFDERPDIIPPSWLAFPG